MGKLGGAELNYSSDIDLMFVGDGPPQALESSARAVMGLAGQSFRVDTNLRPEGRDGPLVRTIESYEAYWDRWAEPWEFQALLKARPVAGDEVLGPRFAATAARWLWNHPFETDDLRSLRAMKHRAEELVARRGLADRELKLGPGGIRDIEFTVQLLQLVHGHADADLRSPTTLVALAEMGEAGYVDPEDATRLAEAYRMLRTVEHRLQLVDEQQVHTLPTDRDALDHLARVLGYRDTTRGTAAEQLDSELRLRRLGVRSIHQRVYFRPLLEAFATGEGALSPEAAVARLQAFGFTDAKRTQAAVRELTRGLNRSSRLMQQMLPLMLDWLSASPDPDLGLLQLRNLLTGSQRQTTLVEAFRESPESAQRLCMLLGTSRLLGETLARNPDLVVRLPDPDRLETRPRDELVASAFDAISWRADRDEKQEALQRWNDRHRLGVAARDLFGSADVHTVGRDLSSLAEATVEATLETLDPHVSVRGDRRRSPRWSRAQLRQRPRRHLRLRRERGRGLRGGRPGGHRADALHRRIDPGRAHLRDRRVDCVPRASRARWRAASTPSARTGRSTPSCGSARPCCGPVRSPATSTSGNGCSTSSPRTSGPGCPPRTPARSVG